MANRSIEQKKLKLKKRGRYARFSGSTSKFVERIGPTPFVEDAQGATKTMPTKMVLVGEISLSKAVINTGRGPDPQRMQQYYNAVATLGERQLTMAEVFKVKNSRYQQVWNKTPSINKINLVANDLGRLDLFFSGPRWFFVDCDYRKRIIKRSDDYPSRKIAMRRLERRLIEWVEQIPIE